MSKNNFPKKPWFKKTNKNVKRTFDNVVQYERGPVRGYHGFQLYFNENENETQILYRTQTFELYIHRNLTKYNLNNIKDGKTFKVDIKELYADEEFMKEWDEFESDIIEKTEFCINCMGLAMHQTIIKELENSNADIANILPIIRCRIYNHEPVLPIKNLGVNSFGKLVSVRGTVIKATNIQLQSEYMTFLCTVCSGTQVSKQPNGIFTLPEKCLTKGCKVKGKFEALSSSPHTRVVNCQSIKVQELIGDCREDSGHVPRTVNCELKEDLVSCCVPGDDVIITGIVKVQSEIANKEKQASSYLLHLEAVSIINERSRSNQGITFNTADYYAIDKIHAEPNKFYLLVHSLCPNIYGHEVVKAGLLLALFGGTKKENMRSDSHVLIVGDPGLGKSQMLQSCSNVAPRGVYICGKTVTNAGLTVTMTRESGGDYALEAGALILADQGCCCIDEFDKMSAQHACLLEVMEQQSISIAKAGVSCNLPARPSILAAANPVGGHYNKALTVAENLKISSPLLSRFDLVFILLDKPNEELDMLLSEHILDIKRNKDFINSPMSSHMSSATHHSINLQDRLQLQQGEFLDRLPHILFRKYIAYARKYVHPKINSEARKVLKEFYVNLRKQYRKGDATPITTRQLSSLIRLVEARAKLDLREEATADDAKDVVDIVKCSLVDIFSDDCGNLDLTRSQNGCGISNRKMVNQYLKSLQQKSSLLNRSIFTFNELGDLTEQIGIPKSETRRIIDSLNLEGFLLKKGGNKFQLILAE